MAAVHPIVVNGDMIVFSPTFGIATVTVPPFPIVGTAIKVKCSLIVACQEGDEASVVVPGCPYVTTAGHTIPGTGIVTIDSWNSDQLTTKTAYEGSTPFVIKGTTGTAKFSVVAPAMIPGSPPVADTTTEYAGTFTIPATINNLVKAE